METEAAYVILHKKRQAVNEINLFMQQVVVSIQNMGQFDNFYSINLVFVMFLSTSHFLSAAFLLVLCKSSVWDLTFWALYMRTLWKYTLLQGITHRSKWCDIKHGLPEEGYITSTEGTTNLMLQAKGCWHVSIKPCRSSGIHRDRYALIQYLSYDDYQIWKDLILLCTAFYCKLHANPFICQSSMVHV